MSPRRLTILIAALTPILFLASCADVSAPRGKTMSQETSPSKTDATGTAVATFGGGCFWCTEAVFLELDGVESVVSGYSGGHVKNPTYREVCTATTGHAEVIQIKYDPSKVSFEDLLFVHFKTHDPTTLNRQGNDVGPQYRSVIFCHDDAQKASAEKVKKALEDAGAFPRKIVTEIVPATVFYPAEDYHQNYYANNPNQPYCQVMIPPKLEKVRAMFKTKAK